MDPIREFTDSLNQRTEKENAQLQTRYTAWVKAELILAAVASVVVLILLFKTFESIVKPTIELVDQAKQLEAGKYSQRNDLKVDNEIGVLAKGFNTMASAISTEVQRLKRNTRKSF